MAASVVYDFMPERVCIRALYCVPCLVLPCPTMLFSMPSWLPMLRLVKRWLASLMQYHCKTGLILLAASPPSILCSRFAQPGSELSLSLPSLAVYTLPFVCLRILLGHIHAQTKPSIACVPSLSTIDISDCMLVT